MLALAAQCPAPAIIGAHSEASGIRLTPLVDDFHDLDPAAFHPEAHWPLLPSVALVALDFHHFSLATYTPFLMSDKAGILEAIWIKRAVRGPMDPVAGARAVRDRGLEGNADQGGKRQITVIEQEVFEQVSQELGQAVDAAARRANLMVSGIRLKESLSLTLCIGNLRLQIHGETRPCSRMDEAVAGLRQALEPDWRAGVYGVVLNQASIRVGDPVLWESQPES